MADQLRHGHALPKLGVGVGMQPIHSCSTGLCNSLPVRATPQAPEPLRLKRRFFFCRGARRHRAHDADGKCTDAAIAVPASCVIEYHVVHSKQLLQRSRARVDGLPSYVPRHAATMIVWLEPPRPNHELPSGDYCEPEEDNAGEYGDLSLLGGCRWYGCDDEDASTRSGPSDFEVSPPNLQKPFHQEAYKPHRRHQDQQKKVEKFYHKHHPRHGTARQGRGGGVQWMDLR